MSRGPHPQDARLFGPDALPLLRTAAEEVVWLLGRRYPAEGVVGFVGARHQLHARQRTALTRSLCSEATRQARRASERAPGALAAETLRIDGFNLVITLEVALGGGPVLLGHDGALRDLAGLRGAYRPHEHTDRALALVMATLAEVRPARVLWYLDRPVSNSGRLRERILAAASGGNIPQEAYVVPDPDRELFGLHHVASSDASVIDQAASWVNLTGEVVRRHVPDAWLVALGPVPGAAARPA